MSSIRALTKCYFLSVLIVFAVAFPDQGKWDFILNTERNNVAVPKSLFSGSQIFIQISCYPEEQQKDLDIDIEWTLSQSTCWQDVIRFENGEPNSGQTQLAGTLPLDNRTHSMQPVKSRHKCASNIILEEITSSGMKSASAVVPEETKDGKAQESTDKNKKGDQKTDDKSKAEGDAANKDKKDEEKTTSVKQIQNPHLYNPAHPVYTVEYDGVYVLRLLIDSKDKFNATVSIQMQGKYGYLSAADWPLLPFYGAMCLVYVILGLAWLIVSFCQWRDLLRIQFWIGGVILLGMLEKATFYAEYQSINSTGVSVKGAMLLAELVSCGKRTLARMLVIIVSLGFGIVKPRLGPMLHRVVGTGLLYFTLAAIESYLRVMHPKNDPSNQILVASIPLAVLDSAICWWIFTSLVQTTRTLRLRRNLVKLSLYRHFTNTLIFAVISSVVFMLYSIKYHRLALCLTDWKELWVDDAYWHLLFSVLLLVIMILWRPTNNNQRYAFTPLLDAPEDDEEDEQFVNDAFGVKMRGYRSNSPKPKSSNSVEDDLKWVEENIPSSLADTALTTMDSDEEIMTTKFEVSKMQ
ncbi:transmembrane protein 87A isoform X2 [Periplaneta americana]|uniref:transmembrane protein 87A isoform X2 n=1 Tax=Periplaneta americana TaxID=6978 RepID=UPI0037E8A389